VIAGRRPYNPPGPNDTPNRNVRVSDEVWDAAMARAVAEGVSVSSVVRDALELYGQQARGRREDSSA
jgi:predicted HicB family RNase H-like nuclease